MEPLEAPDQPSHESSKGTTGASKPSGPKATANLKSAWPLRPDAIQAPRFSLLDEVRSIAQRHIMTQQNLYPLTSHEHGLLPGSSDPSGAHPHLPDATVNALSVRTEALLDQVFGLLYQYRPATAPSTQLRVLPMSWEVVLDILAEHKVVDPAVIDRTQDRLEKLFGSRKTKSLLNKSGSIDPAKPPSPAASSDLAPPGNYLSHQHQDLAFLDNVQQTHERLQAQKDAQQLLLKLTRKHYNISGDSTGSLEQADTQSARPSGSPVPPDGDLDNFTDMAESYPAPSENDFSGSDEEDEREEERATPEAAHAKDEARAPGSLGVDDSPPKIVDGWVVHAPLEEREESSKEGNDEENENNNVVPDDEEVDELEVDAGSEGKRVDDEDDDQSAASAPGAGPETHSDPQLGGAVRSDSDESESVSETSEDETPSGEDSERETNQVMDSRENRSGRPLDQAGHVEEPFVNPSESESEPDSDSDSDSDAELDVAVNEAVFTPKEGTSPAELVGTLQSGILPEREEGVKKGEMIQKDREVESNGSDHYPFSPATTNDPKPTGNIPEDNGGGESSKEDAGRDGRIGDNDANLGLHAEEFELSHFLTVTGRGEGEIGGRDPIQEKVIKDTTSPLVSEERPDTEYDGQEPEEESINDDDNVVQDRRKSPSSSVLEHESGLEDEEIEEESEWEGVAARDSEEESERESVVAKDSEEESEAEGSD